MGSVGQERSPFSGRGFACQNVEFDCSKTRGSLFLALTLQ